MTKDDIGEIYLHNIHLYKSNCHGASFDNLGSTLLACALMGQHAVYYSKDFVLSRDAFDTTRKAAWIAASLDKDPIPGVRLCSPKSVTLADAQHVHSENYLRALQTGQPAALASSSKINWD